MNMESRNFVLQQPMGREILGALHSMQTAKDEKYPRQGGGKDLQEVHQISPTRNGDVEVLLKC